MLLLDIRKTITIRRCRFLSVSTLCFPLVLSLSPFTPPLSPSPISSLILSFLLLICVCNISNTAGRRREGMGGLNYSFTPPTLFLPSLLSLLSLALLLLVSLCLLYLFLSHPNFFKHSAASLSFFCSLAQRPVRNFACTGCQKTHRDMCITRTDAIKTQSIFVPVIIVCHSGC